MAELGFVVYLLVMMRGWWWVLLTGWAVTGCGDTAETVDGAGGAASSSTGGASSSVASVTSSSASTGGGGGATTFGGDRPVTVSIPGDYDGSPAPLVLSLHGYSGTGALHEAYFRLRPEALARGMIFAHPEGTTDGFGYPFWNANAACCDFNGSGVDDSAYLRSLIEEIQAVYAVDDKRIYLVGHSNGHFMAYRMACDHADLVAAVVGLAGGMLPDGMGCAPSEPVHHLHVHGTADTVVPYAGGPLPNGTLALASADETVSFWADQAGCASTPTSVGMLDLDTGLTGDDTEMLRHESCSGAGSAELWRIDGGSHSPSFGAGWAGHIVDHLLAHPKL